MTARMDILQFWATAQIYLNKSLQNELQAASKD